MDDMDDEADEFPRQPFRKPRPTLAVPGSKEKIEVLRRRAELLEELWHDDDKKLGGDECSDLE
jgi:hypothetical protein